MLKRLQDWWHGKWVSYGDPEIGGGIIFIPNGYHQRPWLARAYEAIKPVVKRNAWNIVFLVIGLAGLVLAALAL